MNKEYIVNGDKAFVTDENGKINEREFTTVLEEELVIENCIENLEKKVQKISYDLKNFKHTRNFVIPLTVLVNIALIGISFYIGGVSVQTLINSIPAYLLFLGPVDFFCLLSLYRCNKDIKESKINLEFSQDEIERLKIKLNELENKKALLYDESIVPKTFKVKDRPMMEEISMAMEANYQAKRAKGKRRILKLNNNDR